MKVFLIGRSVQSIQHKQIKFLRQSEQGKLFQVSFFLRKVVVLSRKIVPRCLVKFLHLNKFPIQCVTNFGELAPLEKTFTDKLSRPFNYYFEQTQWVFGMEESDCQLVRYFVLWIVCPFMIFSFMVILF